MPWGHNRIHGESVLFAVKDGLVLADDVPQGLRWAPHYTGLKRVAPGDPAGSYVDRLKQWVVTVKGYPLYSRHAVWMLANDKFIPEGFDVSLPEDPSNLQDPSQLKLVPVGSREASVREMQMVRQAAGLPPKVRIPDKAHFEQITYGNKLTLMVGNASYPFLIAADPVTCVRAATLVAIRLGYIPLEIDAAGLSAPMVDMLTKLVTQMGFSDWKGAGKVSPYDTRKVESFLACIRAEGARIRAAQQAAPVPETDHAKA